MEKTSIYKKRMPFYNFAKAVGPIFMKIISPYTVNNKENMPEEGRVIVCANHLSQKDPVLLALAHKRQIYYMAKAELFEVKFVRKIISWLGAFPVVRGQGDTSAMDTSKSILEREDVLGIFIEGTRSKDGSFGKPHSGAILLAYQNHAPILPMCITAKDGGPLRAFHRVIISCGNLIQPEELGIETGSGTEMRKASRMVMDKIAELRERDLKEFHKK